MTFRFRNARCELTQKESYRGREEMVCVNHALTQKGCYRTMHPNMSQIKPGRHSTHENNHCR
jgi:hypothetical protein